MATIFKNRTKKARSLIAAVACTATLSVVSTLSPVVAQASPATDITALLSSGNASVAQLANALADVQDQVSRIEGEIGGNRENVNQWNLRLAVNGFKLHRKCDRGTSRRGCNRLIADNRRVILKGRKCTIAANTPVQKVGGIVQKKNGLRTVARRSSFIAANP